MSISNIRNGTITFSKGIIDWERMVVKQSNLDVKIY
jgi:hypothetical protein